MADDSREIFEQLAPEYYDSAKHPTCANFREASAYALRTWFDWLLPSQSNICELGAGRSLVVEVYDGVAAVVSRLVITDRSAAMLAHSTHALVRGASLVVADAHALPLRDESCAAVVSVLGDPYNEQATWGETKRVLQSNGLLVFTTPSIEWTRGYRPSQGHPMNSAVFQLAHGSIASIPSVVLPESEQIAMFERSGFQLERLLRVSASQLRQTRLSPKLLDHGRVIDPIVTAYGLKKIRS